MVRLHAASCLQHELVTFSTNWCPSNNTSPIISVCIIQNISSIELIAKVPQSTEQISTIKHLKQVYGSPGSSYFRRFFAAFNILYRQINWPNYSGILTFPIAHITSSGPMAVSLEQLNSTRCNTKLNNQY